MKNFLSLLLLAFLSVSGFCQVKWLNPRPAGYHNQKIQFINNNTGYIMNSGNLLVTNDMGSHWQVKDHFPNATTFALHDSTGIIPVYNTTIYISNNNGMSWQPHATGISGYLSDWTDIVGRDTIYLMHGNHLLLYRSVDRGIHWQTINSNLPSLYPNSINFVTSKIGYAAAPQALYKTTDSGFSWQPILVPYGGNFTYIKFRDSLNGYIHKENDSIYRTRDGGNTWTRVKVYSEIYDINWVDDDHAVAVGENGYMTKTVDGGTSWTTINQDGITGNYAFFSSSFINQDTGVVVGVGGRIYKTVNAGNSWTAYSPTYNEMVAVEFGDVNTGYACTWKNVFKTTDRGASWVQLPLVPNTTAPSGYGQFEFAHFISKDTGILIANDPVKIYKTVDGGQHWDSTYPVPATPNYYQTIKSCSFAGRDTGFIQVQGGIGGALFKTTDAGLTWQNIGGVQAWSKIQFVDRRYGFCIYGTGLLRTTDGGLSWNNVNIPFVDGLSDIWFTDPAKGVVVDHDFARVTSDSGHTWTIPVFPTSMTTYIGSDYEHIRFLDSNTGFITTQYGHIFRTTDAGHHWDTCGFIYGLKTISFEGDSSVIFGGLHGAIVSLDVIRTATAAICGNGTSFLQSILSGNNYQWQVNTGTGYTNLQNGVNYNGVATQGLTLMSIPSSWYGYKYRCKVDNYYTDEFSLKIENNWTGAVNNAWENPGNWSCGTVPDLNTDVIISSGTVIVSSNVVIHTLTLSPNVNFTVTAPYTLTILD